MKRKVYLRMKCSRCYDKSWTSILGLGMIRFVVEDLVDYLYDNPKLKSTAKTPE